MLKILYEFLINPLGLPIEPIWEYLILLVVGEIAHEVAYWISPGGKVFGSIAYWFSKLLFFVAIWMILYAFIVFVQFVIKHWIYFLVGVIILLLVGIIIVCMKKRKKQ